MFAIAPGVRRERLSWYRDCWVGRYYHDIQMILYDYGWFCCKLPDEVCFCCDKN